MAVLLIIDRRSEPDGLLTYERTYHWSGVTCMKESDIRFFPLILNQTFSCQVSLMDRSKCEKVKKESYIHFESLIEVGEVCSFPMGVLHMHDGNGWPRRRRQKPEHDWLSTRVYTDPDQGNEDRLRRYAVEALWRYLFHISESVTETPCRDSMIRVVSCCIKNSAAGHAIRGEKKQKYSTIRLTAKIGWLNFKREPTQPL